MLLGILMQQKVSQPSFPFPAPLRDGTQDEHQSRIYRALVFIEEQLGSRLEVTDVARVACYTPRHLQRVFLEQVGEGVREHIRRLRVMRAATLLRQTDLSVTEAAFASGFDTVPGFNRAFHAVMGCAPTVFCEQPLEREPTLPPLPEDGLMRVTLREEPSRRLAFLRHVGHEVGAVWTWTKLASWAARRGILNDDAVLLGLAHDDYETPTERHRYDACVEIPTGFNPDPGMGVRELPGGLTACHEFRGTLPALEQRWHLFTHRWFPRSGLRLRLPLSYDIYPPEEVQPMALIRHLQPGSVLRATLCLPVMRNGDR